MRNQIKSTRLSLLPGPGGPAVLLSMCLLLQPALGLTAVCGGQLLSKAKRQALTEDQRIAHVLSRLTFGARPNDFARVKAMGVNAYLAQQLDPDSIDDNYLQAKLAKLPTLNLATPV